MSVGTSDSLTAEARTLTAPASRGCPSGPIARFAFELQRRKVCRAAFSYSLVVWVNVQIGDVVFPMAGLPDWCLRLVVIIGLLGLPLVIFLAWTFQITPHGLRIDTGHLEEAAPEQQGRPGRVELAVNLLLLALGMVLVGWLLTQRALGDEIVPGDVVALPGREVRMSLAFQAASSDPESAAVLRFLEAGLRHALIQIPQVAVVVDDATTGTVAEDAQRLLVSGIIRLERGRLDAILDVLDVRTGAYLWSAQFSYATDSLTDVQSALTDRVIAEVKVLLGIEPGSVPNPPRRMATEFEGGVVA